MKRYLISWIDGIHIKSLHINFRLEIRKIKYSHNLTFIQYSRLKPAGIYQMYITAIYLFFRPEQEQDKNKEQPEVSQSAGWCHQSTQQTGSDTSRGAVRDSHQGTELCQAADEEQPAGFRCHDCDGTISLRRCRYHCINGAWSSTSPASYDFNNDHTHVY